MCNVFEKSSTIAVKTKCLFSQVFENKSMITNAIDLLNCLLLNSKYAIFSWWKFDVPLLLVSILPHTSSSNTVCACASTVLSKLMSDDRLEKNYRFITGHVDVYFPRFSLSSNIF